MDKQCMEVIMKNWIMPYLTDDELEHLRKNLLEKPELIKIAIDIAFKRKEFFSLWKVKKLTISLF